MSKFKVEKIQLITAILVGCICVILELYFGFYESPCYGRVLHAQRTAFSDCVSLPQAEPGVVHFTCKEGRLTLQLRIGATE